MVRESLIEGSDEHIKRHKKQGKYTARERIDMLLDQDSPFLELMPLAGKYERKINLPNAALRIWTG